MAKVERPYWYEPPSPPDNVSNSGRAGGDETSASNNTSFDPGYDPERRKILKTALWGPVYATLLGLGMGKFLEDKKLKNELLKTSDVLGITQEELAQQKGENDVLRLKEKNCQDDLAEQTSSLQATVNKLQERLKRAEEENQDLLRELEEERSQRASWQATAVTAEAQKRILEEALRGQINPKTLKEAGEAAVLSVPLEVVDDAQNLATRVEQFVKGNIEEIKDAAIPLAEAAQGLSKTILPFARFGDKIINVLRKFDFQVAGSIIDKTISLLEELEEVEKKSPKKFPSLTKSKLFLTEIKNVLEGQREMPVTPLEDTIQSVLAKIKETDDKLSAKTTDPLINQIGKEITEFAQGTAEELGEWAQQTTERLTREREEREAKVQAAQQLSKFIEQNQATILEILKKKGMEETPENIAKTAQDLMRR